MMFVIHIFTIVMFHYVILRFIIKIQWSFYPDQNYPEYNNEEPHFLCCYQENVLDN